MIALPEIKPEWLAGITMTQVQKDKWLKALRSGEYKQGKRRLLRIGAYHSSYCCLGVAAKVVFDFKDENLRTLLYLYQAEKQFLGTDTGIENLLGTMNDDLGYSFDQLADFIEANIPACDAVQS